MTYFPESTFFNKRIPKQKFYENLNISSDIKRAFVEQVKIIYWKNKIAPGTVNLAKGQNVSEIEVFEIRLNGPEIDEKLLRQIDREIPYHILYLLTFEGKMQAWIGYKESTTGKNAFKVCGYYHTAWMDEEEIPLKLEGLDLDSVYENFVRQIAGEQLEAKENGESLQESIAKDERRKQLEKEIAKLQAKMRKEKQLNKQMEINGEVKRLKRELEKFCNR